MTGKLSCAESKRVPLDFRAARVVRLSRLNLSVIEPGSDSIRTDKAPGCSSVRWILNGRRLLPISGGDPFNGSATQTADHLRHAWKPFFYAREIDNIASAGQNYLLHGGKTP